MRDRKGFSLVEVTLALGVMAFALVGIMAMFPMAMQAARESQQETRATFIAQAIFSELSAGTNAGERVLTVSATNSNNIEDKSFETLDLKTNGEKFVGYTEDGLPVRSMAGVAFSNSSSDWVYATRVSISTNGLIDGLSRVEVEVTAPAAAPLTNRSRYPFITLLRNQ